eukprot:5000084-Pleurochrysis_carterae.AAC.1
MQHPSPYNTPSATPTAKRFVSSFAVDSANADADAAIETSASDNARTNAERSSAPAAAAGTAASSTASTAASTAAAELPLLVCSNAFLRLLDEPPSQLSNATLKEKLFALVVGEQIESTAVTPSSSVQDLASPMSRVSTTNSPRKWSSLSASPKRTRQPFLTAQLSEGALDATTPSESVASLRASTLRDATRPWD